tara:strand:+ start:119 stop:340 length:222 start_codon:yes stop_codon:yes gene_type:complete
MRSFAPPEVSGTNSKPIIAGTSGAKKPFRKGHRIEGCLLDSTISDPGGRHSFTRAFPLFANFHQREMPLTKVA